ncbi:MAG TPA: RDD family protein, partial [Gammaproteobacteria bacterium]|nr:RDD family protein [Gammaproteobacteria bacterium]
METAALEYVGFWARAGATIIDTVLILMVTTPLMLAFHGDSYWVYSDSYWLYTALTEGPIGFLVTWVLPAIAVIIFWMTKQATPGKMVISATIVDADSGKAPTTGQLIGRYLAYYVSSIPLGLGFLWVAFDRKKQGWHDKLAGTVVVRPKHRRPEQV